MKIQAIILCASLAASCLAQTPESTNAPAGTNAAAPSATNLTAAASAATNAPAAPAPITELSGTNGLVINFHDAPLGVVLDYLSAKAGYVVSTDEDIRQKITLESATPVNKQELDTLLNNVLSKNGFEVRIEGRLLYIKRTDSTGQEAPIIEGHDPDQIPQTDKVVTQIIRVNSLAPAQLIKDLEPLIPSTAKVQANDAGNAILMTATQRQIHHFAEIVHALDGSAIASVAVFPLRYADAKSVASELKEVFQSADSGVSRSRAFQQGAGRTRFNFGGGGGPFGGFGGGGGGGGDSAADKNPNNSAVFTSDDNLNAVVAAAPPEIMGAVSNVVGQLDEPVEDIQLVRVFRLVHADPAQIADELTTLFAPTGTDQNNRGPGFQFFRPPFFGGGGGGGANNQSDRMKRQSQVTAVADPRTSSVIVTASRTLMSEIEGVIASLDSTDAHASVVSSYDISSADPADIQAAMQQLFQTQNGRNANNSQNMSPLETRAQQNANTQTTTTTSSFGGSGGGFGATPGR